MAPERAPAEDFGPSGLRRETFGQFDVGSPRIGQERDLQLGVGHLPDRRLDLDPFRLEAADERFEIVHLEADVIERASLGRAAAACCPAKTTGSRREGRRPRSCAGLERQPTHGRRPGFAPNAFTYQALMAGMSIGVVVNVVHAHRRGQRRFAVDLDADAVGREDVDLVGILRRLDLELGGLPLWPAPPACPSR